MLSFQIIRASKAVIVAMLLSYKKLRAGIESLKQSGEELKVEGLEKIGGYSSSSLIL